MAHLNLHRSLLIAATLTVPLPGLLAQSAGTTGQANHVSPQLRPELAIRASGAGTANLELDRHKLTGNPTGQLLLDGLQFLQIHVSGQSGLTSADPTRPRQVQAGTGLSLVELPGPGHMRIAHYSRSAGTVFGFLSLGPFGRVKVLLESSGVGDFNLQDPFDPVIGASRDGRFIAISAPDFSHGVNGIGDCWLFQVDGPPRPGGALADGIELTGPGVQDVPGISLTFKGSYLYAMKDDALARAPIDGSMSLLPVALPFSGGVPVAETCDEMLVSEDQSTLVLLAGSDEQSLDLYVIDASEVPRNLTDNPREIQPAGFLPEEFRGPFIGLNGNGSQVAYVVEVNGGDELYVQDTAPTSPAFHVTDNVSFEHSIDAVSGVLGSGFSFQFMAAGVVNDADLYQVSLNGASLERTNLTFTSGAAGPPFPNAGQLAVIGAWQIGDQRVLVDDNSFAAGGYDLWSTSENGDFWFAGALEEPPLVRANGDLTNAVWLATARTPAGTSILRFDGQDEAPSFVAVVPSSFPVVGMLPDRKGARAALAVRFGGTSDFVVDLSLTGTGAAILNGGPFDEAHNLFFTDQDTLLFSDGPLGNQRSYFAPLPVPQAIPVGASATFSAWLR